MPAERTCSECGAEIPSDARQGLCTRCLFSLGLNAEVGTEVPLPSASITELPGDRIGRYKLLEKIGEGGCGIVYMAEQEEPVRRRVALKVIKPGMDTREIIARFEAERQALALMEHPCIARVFDGGATETGRPYFVMELVRGLRITEYCDQKKLSTRQRLDLFMQVCQAVQHAHQKGIIHRDLKPSNILVTINDGVAVPKVIDFGIVKATGQRLTDKTFFTKFQQLLGTPTYMSPEQAEMTSVDIDTRSDIYSLGVLLYELLTGKTPFDAKELLRAGMEEMLRTIREREPARPSARLSTLTAIEQTTVGQQRRTDGPRLVNLVRGDLDWIVMKCLEKDRARRYDTASAVAMDLQRHLDQEPVFARSPTTVYRVQKFVRRNKGLVTATAAIALALILGIVVSTWQAIEASTARNAEKQQRIGAQTERNKAQSAQMEAEQQTQRAQAALTRLEIERVETMYAASSRARAVAYLARLLRQLPTNRIVAERLVNTISTDSYCLPSVPPLTHTGKVTCAQFSPDGELVITASKDATARIWSAHTGVSVGEPLRHNAGITWAEFSADGQFVVTASDDGTARVWNVQTQQPISPPLKHDGQVLYAAFSPEGLRVVTASQDRTVRCWDWKTGAAASPPIMVAEEAYFACFSPDGDNVLAAIDDGTARIFSCMEGAELVSYPHRRQPDSAIPYPQYSPDGNRVITLQTGDAQVWSVHNGREGPIHLPHKHNVTSAVFSRDGRFVATASLDSTARIWNARTGAAVTSEKCDDQVLAICFSFDGTLFLTGSADKKMLVTSVRSGARISQPLRHELRVMQVRFNSNGRQALTVMDGNQVVLWNIRRKKNPRILQHRNEVHHAVFSPDGLRVATASRDRTARVWDAHTGLAITAPLQQKGWINVIRFSPDSRRIATISDKQEVQIWDAETGDPLIRPEARALANHIFNLQFSPDGRTIALATGGGGWLLDSTTGTVITHVSQSNAVRYIAYNPDGHRVVTASEGRVIRIWNALTGEPVSEELRHDDKVLWADFSPDGGRIATASRDKTVRIWDVETGRMLTKPLVHADALSDNHSVQFSPDGKWIATAAGKAAQVWSAETSEPSALRLEHITPVNSVRFSPDGKRLITAAAGDDSRVWDVVTGHALSNIPHQGGCPYAEFSPDGQFALTASVDGTARIWWVPQVPTASPEWLPDLAEALSGRRIDDTGSSEIVPVVKLFEVVQKLTGPSAVTRSTEFYSKWAEWLLTGTGE